MPRCSRSPGCSAASTFVTDAMRAQTDDPLLAATDLAELLVRRGTPFREAHAVVGALVRESLDGHRSLAELVAAEPRLGAEGVGAARAGGRGRAADDAGRGRARAARRAARGDAGAPRPSGAVARLTRAFYDRDPLELAPELLNKVLVSTEARDAASRPGSWRSRRTAGRPTRRATRTAAAPRATPRCSAVPAGCTCTSCTACTGAPTWSRRHRRTTRARCCCGPRSRSTGSTSCGSAGPRPDATETSAPARRAWPAFGLDRAHDGVDLVRGPLGIHDDGTAPPSRPRRTVRVGLRPGRGDRERWRWFVPGVAEVSGPR